MSINPKPSPAASDHIRVPSIPDVVYETLRADIGRGLYEPGPISIRQLAERFGVSAMPVREALRRLQAEGLISFTGTRQVAVTALSLSDLDEIFLIRKELESLALRLAVPALADDAPALAKLDALVAEMDEHGDYDHWRQTNASFHLTLYEAANKPRLLAMISSQNVAVEPYARRYGVVGDGLAVAQAQHRQMVDAVRARDDEQAVAVLRVHLDVAFDVFRQAAREL